MRIDSRLRGNDRCYQFLIPMPLPILESLGLTSNEAILYELLLRMGEQSVSILARESGLKRTNVYYLLGELQKKGLISSHEDHKKTFFKLESPQKLIELADNQLKEKERIRTDLSSLLPDLTSSYILTYEKPIVTLFEGVQGLKQIYEDTLREGKPIYAALLPYEIDEELRKWLRTTYLKKRTTMKIHANVLIASNSFASTYKQEDTKYERTTFIVPQKKFPFQQEVNIYGDKVAIMNYKKGEHLIGMIIHNPLIAKTFKALYDLAWEAAEALYAKRYISSLSKSEGISDES